MHVDRYATADQFLAAAEPFLVESEVENTLIFGIARALVGLEPKGGLPYFATVSQRSTVLAAAFSSVPSRLGITRARRPEALAPLAADADAACPLVENVHGPEPDAGTFADLLASRRGGTARLHMRQRIYELIQVTQPTRPAPGSLRPATDADLPIVIEWVHEFLESIGDAGDPSGMARDRITNQQLFLWVDGRPVSMAGWTGKTNNGVRIAMVYTPQELRGKGYASASVAALSQLMLERGNRFCCLYTDLGNPTSNAIYQRIGYCPHSSAAAYRIPKAGAARETGVSVDS